MIGLLEQFYKNKEIQSIINGLEEGLKEQLVSGMATSSRSLLMAALYKKQSSHNLLLHTTYFKRKKYMRI